MTTSLTSIGILAAAHECLAAAGYSAVESSEDAGQVRHPMRLFEDPYGVVGIVVFDTWVDLRESWAKAQAHLVERISVNVGSGEAKSWDGYLVLFTPALMPAGETITAQNIRYDTTRLRKLLATGSELTSLEDVRKALLPLLPVPELSPSSGRVSALDALPRLLSNQGFDEGTVRGLVEAFRDQRSLMEALHGKRTL